MLYTEHLLMYFNVISKNTHGPHCIFCQERQGSNFFSISQFPCTHDIKNFNYKIVFSYTTNSDKYNSEWINYFRTQFQFQKHILTEYLHRSVKMIPTNTRLLLFHLEVPKLCKKSALLLCSGIKVQPPCRVFVVVETSDKVIEASRLGAIFSNIKINPNIIFIIGTKTQNNLMTRIVNLLKSHKNRLSMRRILDCLESVFVVSEKQLDLKRCFFCL